MVLLGVQLGLQHKPTQNWLRLHLCAALMLTAVMLEFRRTGNVSHYSNLFIQIFPHNYVSALWIKLPKMTNLLNQITDN